MLEEVTGIRYVAPLREGGSLPGIVEADNLGTYVVKFRGAGQGVKALIAEIVSGELARRLALPVPELVLVDFDPVIAQAEPDEEIQDLLKASGGVNLGMDFLPGALGFDPAGFTADPDLAARILWFDSFAGNVDRSWRNPNLLVWHGNLWMIDHGATLIFHHNWPGASGWAQRTYPIEEHVLSRTVTDLAAADGALRRLITPEVLAEVLSLVPDEWLVDEPGFDTPAQLREAYVSQLRARADSRTWLPEGLR